MNKLMAMAVMAAVASPMAASAQSYSDQNGQRTYSDQNAPRTYRGEDGRYYQCKHSNGTTGTVAGGVGGALLGRHLDKANNRHRDGC